jgi:hypothetical protein
MLIFIISPVSLPLIFTEKYVIQLSLIHSIIIQSETRQIHNK